MLEVYVDGASKGDPGPSGVGIFIKNGKDHYAYSLPIGLTSNHEAEFTALIKALEICLKQFPEEIISVRSDSKLVVDCIEHSKTKQERFLPLLREAEQLGSQFPLFFIKWIPEKQNKRADELARAAIHEN
ncbi:MULTISPECIES: ribonuclease HI family protein [Pontibacillus]|uniref:Ribonuclease HI family protein n=1 Tax=Pontibacillus chungwhensis TaxID=265426 RepID=A0ABY8UXG6_9BACI|nr:MULTISPECIES: ribonuclease HI family protein [Pontibacillus]MCD5322932.1 ribonuclease HI family protein [Pontibacillus sp. HN14]WIF96326.1 ribonuclease HI family protein [Pontibacillus chungwhensis]